MRRGLEGRYRHNIDIVSYIIELVGFNEMTPERKSC